MFKKSPFRIIIGRAGSGKSRLCLEEIRQKLKDDPRGNPLIYLVPEQSAFQFEQALSSTPGLEGIIRAQVLSFRRLAWKVMQEVGASPSLYIDDTGKGMLARKILEKYQEDLTILRSAGDKAGTVGKIVDFFNELKRSKVPLSRMKEQAQSNSKLMDLSFIFFKLEEEMEGLYKDSEDYLSHLADRLDCSDYISGSEIWVDEFYGFTNQEYEVLEKMLDHCSGITVTLCLDRGYSTSEKIDQLNLFYPTALTCQNLKGIAEKAGVAPEVVILKQDSTNRFSQSPELHHLEREFSRPFQKPYKNKNASGHGSRPPFLLAAPNRRQEIEYIARKIIALVRDKDCRWRDTALMVSDLDSYKDIITTVFREYKIPHFLDYKRTVLHHPLVEFVRSALEAVHFNWTYDAVFRCIKTEMLFPVVSEGHEEEKWREYMWQLENYVLAFGIKGYGWLDEKPWSYVEGSFLDEDKSVKINSAQKQYLETINYARDILRAPLIHFQGSIANAFSAGDIITAIENLLEKVQAARRIEAWSKKAVEGGNPEKAREHIQVYKGLMGLLEQMAGIMAQDRIAPTVFMKILESGFEGMRLGLVPPAVDQVLVGDLERTRPGSIKHTFIPGANEGYIPSPPKEDAIISEQERESLIARGIELAPGSLRRLFDKQFLTYMVLTRASEGLWVSYSLADQEGNALPPSQVIHEIKEIFPGIKEVFEMEDLLEKENSLLLSDEGVSVEDLIQLHALHPRKTLNSLTDRVSRWGKGENIHPFWWEVYNWFVHNEQWRTQARQVLSAIFYRNQEKPLDKEVSRSLYGNPLKVSISRLEKYRACPFAHFAQYGLKLKERKVYRLEVPDIGQLYHAALLSFARTIAEAGVNWGELSEDECFKMAEKEIDRLAPRLQKEVLFSTPRYRFIIRKLKNILGRTSVILGKQAQKSSFTPIGLELSFGREGELPPVVFRLSDEFQVEMAGRIDRVDLARAEDGTAYVRIIDYKSGPPELRLAEIYHGLALQLMVYLDVVLTNAQRWLGEEVQPAGILYFYVHAPLIRTTRILNPREIEKKIQRSYRMKGRVLADRKAIALMDSSLLPYGDSDIIPAGVTQKGGFHKHSKVMENSFLTAMRQHVRDVIIDISSQISQGRLDILPYCMGKKKACDYCSYKAVCQFEPLLEENRFEVLRDWTEGEIQQHLLPEGRFQGRRRFGEDGPQHEKSE